MPESDVRLIGETSVAIATAPDVVRARDRAHRVSTVVHGHRDRAGSATPSPSPEPDPTGRRSRRSSARWRSLWPS